MNAHCKAIASKMMAKKLHMEPERGAPWKKASFQSYLVTSLILELTGRNGINCWISLG